MDRVADLCLWKTKYATIALNMKEMNRNIDVDVFRYFSGNNGWAIMYTRLSSI